MQEEPGPSKKRIQKAKCVAERQEMRERLDAYVAEVDSYVDDF
jgi:hypothetical protein